MDRLGELLVLQHQAHFKPPHPQLVRVPRPDVDAGVDGPAQPDVASSEATEAKEAVRFSTREEIRAFFRGESTTAVVGVDVPPAPAAPDGEDDDGLVFRAQGVFAAGTVDIDLPDQ